MNPYKVCSLFYRVRLLNVTPNSIIKRSDYSNLLYNSENMIIEFYYSACVKFYQIYIFLYGKIFSNYLFFEIRFGTL